MKRTFAVPVVEASQVGDARRLTARFTAELEMAETERAQAALVVTELGNNLVKYAKNGQIVIRALGDTASDGIEILSLDSGPGIVDVAQCLADGYSSGGTPGNGLGAVKRLSHRFEVYTAPEIGTAIMSHIVAASRQPRESNARLQMGAICIPLLGEDVCGDAWSFSQNADHGILTVVDGLGHGPLAAASASEALRVVAAAHDLPAKDLLEHAHGALRTTHGAVMAIAEINFQDRKVSYVGVGNIAGRIIDGSTTQHMISMNGTVGLVATIRPFHYDWPQNAVMILTSDGLTNHWQLDRFPGLLMRHPSLVAGILYQNYSRGHDDATVVVARWNLGQ